MAYSLSFKFGVFVLYLLVVLMVAHNDSGGATEATWRGLKIEPESRCSAYNQNDYVYPQSVELDILESMDGLIYSPYTGEYFADIGETDIEHIIARSEAHDSGLCSTSIDVRRMFASDLVNLTLASPHVNRTLKGAKDAAEWAPEINLCWFADRIIDVRQKYGLTIDSAEARVVDSMLVGCSEFEIDYR